MLPALTQDIQPLHAVEQVTIKRTTPDSRATFITGVTATLLALLPATPAAYAQTLETETARLLPKRVLEVGGSFEYQTASEGRERAIPLILEYGLADRLELALEPVPYTAIRPNAGQRASGPGDLEVTLTQLLIREEGTRPAFAIAAELKVPTASNRLIGTGKPDYTGYLILSKRLGAIDSHVNLGYTVPGSPTGATLSNYVHGAAAMVYRLRPRTDLFAEVLGQTAASPEGEGDTGAGPVPEAGGAELVGTLGVARKVTRATLLFGSLSYDNNSAFLIRTGFTIRR